MTTKIPTEKYRDKSLWGSFRKARYAFIKERINLFPKNGTLLDVGAGPSPFEDLYVGFKKTAIDFSPYEGIDVIHDLEKGLPFKDEGYDIVLNTDTLEHIYNPKELLKECYRVTKKGGMFLGTTPFQLCVHQEPHDYFRYTNFALKRMLTDAGYTEIVVTPLGTHYELLGQTADHFYSSLESRVKGKSVLKFYAVRVFWKLNKILQLLITFTFGELPPSEKHTLGYGFMAKKS